MPGTMNATPSTGRSALRRLDDQRLKRRACAGDKRADSRLVERYLPLARNLALRFRHSPEPLDDLSQVANLGLIKAVQRWDPDRGLAFSSFAVPTILGELRRYFRDSTWLVRPPRGIQELSVAVDYAREELWRRLDRSPSTSEVADHLGSTVEAVVEAAQVKQLHRPVSLDAPLFDAEEGETGVERVADDRDEPGQIESDVSFEQISGELDERSREVVRLRFREGLLQREIGERLGCSQMQVSRVLHAALPRLREQAATASGLAGPHAPRR